MSSIRDPLYGIIQLKGKIESVVNTPIFQRTKRIHQLGFMNHVFPSANHTRFEHLLGTMYVTELAIEFLKMNEDVNPNTNQVELIKLAALLHDLGHGPFSHTIEELHSFERCYYGRSRTKKIDHEEKTYDLILNDKGIAEVLSRRDRDRIVNFLKGSDIGGIPGELVTGDVGSDRLDYLNRDAFHSGLLHRFDVFSLLPHLRLSKTPRHCIAIAGDGISAVELFMTARYHHYAVLAYCDEWRSREFLLLKSLAMFAKSQSKPQLRIDELDEVGVIAHLRSFPESNLAIGKIDDGKQLYAAYSLPLKDIRAGLVKYMLYRLYFSCYSKRLYLQSTMKSILDSMPAKYRSLSPTLDLRLWAHHVPDLVIKPDVKINPPDEYSPLVADRSALIRMIAGAQVLASKLYLWCEEKPDESFKEWLYEHRSLIHGSGSLIPPFQREGNGSTPLDFLLLFLHCLIDLKRELGNDICVRQDASPSRLCGVVRLYSILQKCQDYLRRKDFKIEAQGTHFEFSYSEEVFSTLNALNALNVIRMNQWGERSRSSKKSNEKFREMYTFDVTDNNIRNTLLQRGDLSRLRDDIMKQLRRISKEKEYLEEFQKLYGADG